MSEIKQYYLCECDDRYTEDEKKFCMNRTDDKVILYVDHQKALTEVLEELDNMMEDRQIDDINGIPVILRYINYEKFSIYKRLIQSKLKDHE